jgi:DNA-binding NarL/FixJ family response regulator
LQNSALRIAQYDQKGESLKVILTKRTVSNYFSAMLNKFDVEGRTQTAILAIRHELVTAKDLG